MSSEAEAAPLLPRQWNGRSITSAQGLSTYYLTSLPGMLTCLHKNELRGLLANAVHSSAVVVPEVIFRVWCHLWKE